jgi:hypothetical protein
MQHHYSTVNASEQREGIARVVHLFKKPTALAPGGEVGGEAQVGGGELKEKTG